MAQGGAVEAFRKQLGELIKRFKQERDRHKFWGLWLKLATAGLAAIATVSLGWKATDYADALKNLALVANALITVLAAHEAFFEPRKLWVRETAVLNSLRDIERDLDVESARGDLSAEQLAPYQKRVNETLQNSLNAWLKDKSAAQT